MGLELIKIAFLFDDDSHGKTFTVFCSPEELGEFGIDVVELENKCWLVHDHQHGRFHN